MASGLSETELARASNGQEAFLQGKRTESVTQSMGAYQPGAANWAPAQSTRPGMIPGSELGLSGM